MMVFMLIGSESDYYWPSFLSLWTRYCGVSDELRVLKQRWMFDYGQNPFSMLPDQKECSETLARLANLLEVIESNFATVGLRRHLLDDKKRFAKKCSILRPLELYILLSSASSRLNELCEYVGALKIALAQRTVSDEISQSITGYPRSPERTVGNELMYKAADNLAKAYESSFQLCPGVRWDGVVSFLHSPGGNHMGGVVRSSDRLGLFHVRVIEENKYFPAAYVVLAHEIAHGALFSPYDPESHSLRGWVRDFWPAFSRAVSPWYFSGSKLELFEQCFADLLGVEVAGPGVLFLLNDLSTTIGTSANSLFRIAFVHYFHGDDWRWSSNTSVEIDRLLSQLARVGWRQEAVPVLDEARRAGRATSRSNRAFLRDLKQRSQRHFKKVLTEAYDLESKDIPKHPGELLSIVVANKFDPSRHEEERSLSALRELKPVYDVDPRLMIHCYYAEFRKCQVPPSYATLVQSLAFSRYDPHQKEG